MRGQLVISIISVLLLISTLVFVPVVHAEIADHVVISEIQADSVSGTGGTEDDWIELYNPTASDIDLAAGKYRIEKTKTAANPNIVIRIGNTSDGSYRGTTIPAHGFYLIVRDDASATLKDKADAIGKRDEFTWTGSGYTFYLGTGAIDSDTDPDIVDKVGFGSDAKYYEGTGPAPEIPEGKSLQRKVNATINESASYGPAWDSNNNSADFFIQTNPNPQNSGAKPVPPIPELPSIFLLSMGLLTLATYIIVKKRKKEIK